MKDAFEGILAVIVLIAVFGFAIGFINGAFF